MSLGNLFSRVSGARPWLVKAITLLPGWRSLFWKIFLAIWLSSLVVLGVTLVLISQMNERDRVNNWLLDSVRFTAEQLIDEYEATDGLSDRRRRYYAQRFERGFIKRWERERHQRWRVDGNDGEHNGPHAHHDGPGKHDKPFWKLSDNTKRRLLPRIRIYDVEGDKQIFGGPPRPSHEKAPHVLRVQSEGGRNYRIDVTQLQRRSPFHYLMGFILSYQVIVILLGSALASVLLSWLIIRPLNQLRDHTRDIHQGDLGSRAGQALSRRRDELGELSREFNQMADYVEQTLVGGQRLLQDVSHELRAPLARLQVAAGLVEQKLGEGERLTGRINQECDQLNRLIDEILTLSRLDAQPLDQQPWALAELLQELADDIRFSAPQRPLHLPPALATGAVIAQLPGNRALVQRALSNLLSNALRHTPAQAAIWVAATVTSTSTLTSTLTSKTAMAMATTAELTLTIRDEGPGVTEALLPTLLEPFVRADNQSEGYGLGLSIACRAVERLGGQLSVRNHPQGGFEVAVRLPCNLPVA